MPTGNISIRTDDGLVAITPSGIKYDVLQLEDLTIVDLDGKIVNGFKKPSSETLMHNLSLNISPYELFVCGAPIPVAPWACPSP